MYLECFFFVVDGLDIFLTYFLNEIFYILSNATEISTEELQLNKIKWGNCLNICK